MEECKNKSSYMTFLKTIKKVKDKRHHEVINSYGIYDGYKYYRITKPKDKKYNITESQYFYITREINKKLGEAFVNGEDIKFPLRMGKIGLRKYDSKITYNPKLNKVETNLPINWHETLKLWWEDKDSYKIKTLIRVESKKLFKIYYDKATALYNNKFYYDFNVIRKLKIQLKDNINNNLIDAFSYKKI